MFEAYVTNLGMYPEYGVEVGEYLKFPTTVEEVQALFSRIGMKPMAVMFVSTRTATLLPAAMCSTIGVNSSSIIPGWMIFPMNTAFPMSTPETKRRKPALFWKPSNNSKRPRQLPTRIRRGLPMRSGRLRAKLARGSSRQGACREPPVFLNPPGRKEAVCRSM